MRGSTHATAARSGLATGRGGRGDRARVTSSGAARRGARDGRAGADAAHPAVRLRQQGGERGGWPTTGGERWHHAAGTLQHAGEDTGERGGAGNGFRRAAGGWCGMGNLRGGRTGGRCATGPSAPAVFPLLHLGSHGAGSEPAPGRLRQRLLPLCIPTAGAAARDRLVTGRPVLPPGTAAQARRGCVAERRLRVRVCGRASRAAADAGAPAPAHRAVAQGQVRGPARARRTVWAPPLPACAASPAPASRARWTPPSPFCFWAAGT